MSNSPLPAPTTDRTHRPCAGCGRTVSIAPPFAGLAGCQSYFHGDAWTCSRCYETARARHIAANGNASPFDGELTDDEADRLRVESYEASKEDAVEAERELGLWRWL